MPFSPLVSFKSSQHIDYDSATPDSNLPTKDTDGDGMPDWWEIQYFLDPYDATDASLDADMDGHDRNKDGILDEEEYFTNLMEYEMDLVIGDWTDPNVIDTDNDGMPDGWEVYYNFNPLLDSDADEDSDEDGYDSNRDTFLNSEEEHTNVEEYLAGTNPWEFDTDGDKMSDGWELFYSLNPSSSADAWIDSDADGWDSNFDDELEYEERYLNYMEYLNDTHPFESDTDGDTMPDGWEVYFDLEPLRPSDNFEDKEEMDLSIYMNIITV